MTLFVTLYFPTPSDHLAAHELADKNRPGTVFNYLPHILTHNLALNLSKVSPKTCVSTLKHSAALKKSGLKMWPLKLALETQILENFEGQAKSPETSLNPLNMPFLTDLKGP
jgi:hypothetical protein